MIPIAREGTGPGPEGQANEPSGVAAQRFARVALAIAGSDSGGGAGIQADLKTFAAQCVFGVSAITAITAQNTQDVHLVAPMAPEIVAAQIDAVASDFRIDATKIGMLAGSSIVHVVADAIERHRLANVVLDPVLTSTSGTPLMDAPGLDALRSRLLPLATVVTPNTLEAGVLAGFEVRTLDDARRAARELARLGARAVIITGGHLEERPIDLVYDAGGVTALEGDRIDSRHTHGTGCTFSAAVAAGLARGETLLSAARAAKAYVAMAIRRAPGLGRGRGPLGHF